MNLCVLAHSSFPNLEPIPIYRLKKGETFWAHNSNTKKTFYRKIADDKISPVNTEAKFNLSPFEQKFLVFRKEFSSKEDIDE